MEIVANPSPLIPVTINGYSEKGVLIPLNIGTNVLPNGETLAKVNLESASYNGVIQLDNNPFSVRLAGKLSLFLSSNLLSNLFTFKWRTSLRLKFKLHVLTDGGLETVEYIMPKGNHFVDIAVAETGKLESVEITLLDKSVANTLLEIYCEFGGIKEKLDSLSISLIKDFMQSYKLPYYLIGKKVASMTTRDNIDEIALMAAGTIPFNADNIITIIAKNYKLTTLDVEAFIAQQNKVTVEQLKAKHLNDNDAVNLAILLNVQKGVWKLD